MGELTTKYRPTTLDQVIGQDSTVNSIRSVLKAKTSRSFLFTGPSGTGKTTLARIIAREVGCHLKSIIEIDAASNSGVDEMRRVTEGLAFKGMVGSGIKMVIVDECHALSKQAWQALLKIVEEPPPHIYWCLCTTEADKVPITQMTRVSKYVLNAVDDDALLALLKKVVEQEGFETPEPVLDLIVQSARGSPRAALSALTVVASCTKTKEAAHLLREVGDEQKDVIDLVRRMLKNPVDWGVITETLQKVDTRNPESVRIVIVRYLGAVALKSPSMAPRALEMMSAFEQPYPQQNGVGSLLLSFGRLVFQE